MITADVLDALANIEDPNNMKKVLAKRNRDDVIDPSTVVVLGGQAIISVKRIQGTVMLLQKSRSSKSSACNSIIKS